MGLFIGAYNPTKHPLLVSPSPRTATTSFRTATPSALNLPKPVPQPIASSSSILPSRIQQSVSSKQSSSFLPTNTGKHIMPQISLGSFPATPPLPQIAFQETQNNQRMNLLIKALNASTEKAQKNAMSILVYFIKNQPADEKSIEDLPDLMRLIFENFIENKMQSYDPFMRLSMLNAVTTITDLYLSVKLCELEPKIDVTFKKQAKLIKIHIDPLLKDTSIKNICINNFVHVFNQQVQLLEKGKRFELANAYDMMLVNLDVTAQKNENPEVRQAARETYNRLAKAHISVLSWTGKAGWNETQRDALLYLHRFLECAWDESAWPKDKKKDGFKKFKDACFQDRWYEMTLLLRRLGEGVCYDTNASCRKDFMNRMITLLEEKSPERDLQLLMRGAYRLEEVDLLNEFTENFEIHKQTQEAIERLENVFYKN